MIVKAITYLKYSNPSPPLTDAKEQAILKGDDLEDRLEETYRSTVNKINEINTRIQIPPLTEIWKTAINKIYEIHSVMCKALTMCDTK